MPPDRLDELHAALCALLASVHPVLAAYRSGPAEITREQITQAWADYDAAREALDG